MTDKISKARRSQNMQRIRSTNTWPELAARSALYKLGLRYKLHKKDMPGKPDIVSLKHKLVIFVHGCFWHRHKNCIEASRPKTNSHYWENKIKKNVERDKEHTLELKKAGWNIVTIWECELINNPSYNYTLLKKRLRPYIGYRK